MPTPVQQVYPRSRIINPCQSTESKKVTEEQEPKCKVPEPHKHLCYHTAAFSLKWEGLQLTDADIRDTLATYFKTKERWIYKAG